MDIEKLEHLASEKVYSCFIMRKKTHQGSLLPLKTFQRVKKKKKI